MKSPVNTILWASAFVSQRGNTPAYLYNTQSKFDIFIPHKRGCVHLHITQFDLQKDKG